MKSDKTSAATNTVICITITRKYGRVKHSSGLGLVLRNSPLRVKFNRKDAAWPQNSVRTPTLLPAAAGTAN